MAVAEGNESRPVEPAVRVSTLELFFDLVFVFTVTQLTDVLAHDLNAKGVSHVLLMLWLIWWMYSGYAWLTNAVAPSSTTRRTLLLTGMAGFLIIALAIPEAFGATGWAFGVGYLIVNTVHGILFVRASDESIGRAAMGLAPLNILAAALVLAGGLLPEEQRWAWWTGAVVVQAATPYLSRLSGFAITPGHFVERHSLVVIIAIGESIVAIGVGFAGVTVGWGGLLVAVLGLIVAYYFWWAYFSGDEVRSEHALAALHDPLRRARVALWAWGYAHLPMILGIVAFSAGIKSAVTAPFDPLKWPYAIALAAGAALFLVGHAMFLGILRLSGIPHRLIAAVLVMATAPLGHVNATAQLVAIPVIMATAMIIEDIPRLRRTGGTSIHTFGR